MASSTIPYDWLRRLQPELLRLDDIPLMGNPPLFPWESFTKYLRQLFEYDSLQITPGEYHWREKEHLFSDLKGSLVYTNFGLPTFDGNITWVFPEADIPHLMVLLLEKEANLSVQDITKDYQDGFYRFLAVEILNAFSEVEFDKTLTPHLLSGGEAPNAHSLCLDISFSFKTHTFMGRLFISEEFRHSWKQHYADKKLMRPDMEQRARALRVTIQIEGGRTPLSIREWKKVRKGDFLFLEQCSLKEAGQTGRVLITYRGSPIFIGELSNGKIKLTQSHEYHEVKIAMSQDHDETEDEELDEEMTDEEFDFSLDEDDFKTEESDVDEDSESEEDAEVEEEEDSALEEEESEIEEEESESEEEIEDRAKNEIKKAPSPPSKKLSGSSSGKIEEIPVPLVVELGRIEITIEKLLQLQAGNLLELDVHPEDGVDLVMNGNCIGKGELYRIGDALGVRITEIG